VRIEGSQKTAKGVHVEDLAKYIDERRGGQGVRAVLRLRLAPKGALMALRRHSVAARRRHRTAIVSIR